MARFIKSQKSSIGSSPESMVFRGERKSDKVRISVIEYNQEVLEERDIRNLSEIDVTRTDRMVWLNVDGLHDSMVMQQIAEIFQLSPLIISDVLETHNRPKVHEYDDCVYISTKMLNHDEKTYHLASENLVLIVKDNVLISFQERIGDVFDPVRERLRSNRKRFRAGGSDYLAYALLDTVIDNYIYIISRLGEKIENLDESLTSKSEPSSLDAINHYKSEIIYLRKIIKPCREVVLNLEKIESDLIHSNLQVHLRSLHSNIELANETIDNYREILSDMLNVFHTMMSNKLNDVLKMLTIFSVIFIPITFIVGVYGTNFDYLPELHFRYGYFVMWLVIILLVACMILYFKRKKWM